jgi:hypothetical protein
MIFVLKEYMYGEITHQPITQCTLTFSSITTLYCFVLEQGPSDVVWCLECKN